MRVLLLTLSIISLIFFQAKAQNLKTYYVIKTWEVPVQVIPRADQIRYPEFKEGMVYYINGKSETRKLNYSILYGEMHYLDSEGDTLALDNEQLVKRIEIGEDDYYSMHGLGYVEVLSANAPIQIARKQVIKVIVWGRISPKAYSYDNTYKGDVPTLRQIYHQKTEGLMKMVREVSYVFIDQNQRFYPAKKSVLLKLFPGQKRKIDRFARTNKIDFKNPEDLQKIVEFAVNNQKIRLQQESANYKQSQTQQVE
jgi:hypothetical protein